MIQQYQNERINILNQNLQSAIEIFDALGAFGLTYVPDPKTPFTKFSESRVGLCMRVCSIFDEYSFIYMSITKEPIDRYVTPPSQGMVVEGDCA